MVDAQKPALSARRATKRYADEMQDHVEFVLPTSEATFSDSIGENLSTMPCPKMQLDSVSNPPDVSHPSGESKSVSLDLPDPLAQLRELFSDCPVDHLRSLLHQNRTRSGVVEWITDALMENGYPTVCSIENSLD